MKPFTFGRGPHQNREHGMCIMEAAAMLSGEKHTDAPECACSLIRIVCTCLNDFCTDEYRASDKVQMLPYRVIGTKTTNHETDKKRYELAYQWCKERDIAVPVRASIADWARKQVKGNDGISMSDSVSDEFYNLIDKLISFTEIKEQVRVNKRVKEYSI